MSNETFSPQESLRLIQNMIEKTKENISGQSHYFLLWGWGAFLAFTGQYILKVWANYEHHYIVWLVTIICILAMILLLKRDKNKLQVRTYAGESMGHLWSGLGIAFFVLSMIFVKIGFEYCYPFFILLYGVGTFISGRILKFTPLIIGGLFNFALAAISVWYSMDYQLLFGAAAILTSYIIPGHMLRNTYKLESTAKRTNN